jgi:hypothetical protein
MKPEKKQAAWMYDLRVRARLLQSGALDPKVVERYLAELPDLEGYAETIPFEQPALSDGGHPHSPGRAWSDGSP